MAVGAEGDGLFAGVEAGNEARVAAGDRIQISFLVRTDTGDPLRVGRDHEGGAIHTFDREWAGSCRIATSRT